MKMEASRDLAQNVLIFDAKGDWTRIYMQSLRFRRPGSIQHISMERGFIGKWHDEQKPSLQR